MAGAADGIETRQSWIRLGASVLLSTIGGVGMWSVVVVLPTVQAEFGAARAEASLPYTLVMIGFATGGVLMGRFADRRGIVVPATFGAITMALGYLASAAAGSLWQFTLAHGLLIGIGSSASFGPLVADISAWFSKRRGLAVAICASGNYVAGTFWPLVIQHLVVSIGWRATHVAIGLFCAATMLPLALALRAKPPALPALQVSAAHTRGRLGLAPGQLQALLAIAGIACCVAMAMPQVHIVAYCSDLGYGVARGAEMLALMLGCGIASRIGSGFIADKVGGLATLLLGSALQAATLVLYLGFDGLSSLYVISALFGLVQGGIVPSYAIVVREYFAPNEAGTRVGIVLMASLFGMAFGGWLSGAIFDLTGSYRAAFANGALWNLINIAIIAWLLLRTRGVTARRPGYAAD